MKEATAIPCDSTGAPRERPVDPIRSSHIEGSTRLWEEHTAEMEAALERHDEIMNEVIEAHGGYVFSTAGDAFVAAFARADQAVGGARALQVAIGAEPWPEVTPIRVRMGIHQSDR